MFKYNEDLTNRLANQKEAQRLLAQATGCQWDQCGRPAVLIDKTGTRLCLVCAETAKYYTCDIVPLPVTAS